MAATRERRAWQRMLSGRRLDLADPSPLDIEIEDIAHGLARTARWNGQTKGEHIFSVAQHTLLVEALLVSEDEAAPGRLRLAALLHDAAEYVIGDLISPFKAMLSADYKAAETRILAAVHLRFGLPAALPAADSRAIKEADRAAAFLEAVNLAGFSLEEARRYFRAHASRAASRRHSSPPGRRTRRRGAISRASRRSPTGRRRHPDMARTPHPRHHNVVLVAQEAPMTRASTKRLPMSSLHVCPLSSLHTTVEATNASHIVTLISADTMVERPVCVSADRHLVIAVNDISEPADGQVMPSDTHVEQLLAFVHGWDRKAPMVIHCYAGISRSTAAAFIAACALTPQREEAAIAHRLRAASPTATPNSRLVSVADQLLRRDGRMVAAIGAIGRGAFAAEGKPFALEIN